MAFFIYSGMSAIQPVTMVGNRAISQFLDV